MPYARGKRAGRAAKGPKEEIAQKSGVESRVDALANERDSHSTAFRSSTRISADEQLARVLCTPSMLYH